MGEEGLNGGEITGIVLGTILSVFLVGSIVYLVLNNSKRRRRKSKRKEESRRGSARSEESADPVAPHGEENCGQTLEMEVVIGTEVSGEGGQGGAGRENEG